MSLKLGKAFGIGVYVHWTFSLLLLFVVFANIGKGLGVALFALLVIVGLFACVVLHEFGHALMARQFGIPTRDITLYPIGGIARLERMSERPAEEFLIAVAGPAVNVVIAILLVPCVIATMPAPLLAALASGALDLEHQLLAQPLLPQYVLTLLLVNITLVLFNMAPAFPMDGGRVLRALLASVLDYVRATEIATQIGLVVAGLFGIVAVFGIRGSGPSPMLLLVALFVFFAGQQELGMVRYRAACRARQPLEQLNTNTSYVFDQRLTPPEPNFSGFTWDRQAGVWIEWHEGRPIHACQVG